MLSERFIRSLFASDLPEPDHWEARYPPRRLPRDAMVTRFGPSPTGFLHTGGVYAATIAKDLATHSGGVYFVRIEDTDRAREVPEARDQFARAFAYFSIESDETDPDGAWGPYEQSKREATYHTYARELLRTDHAYLCFCTREELAAAAERQQAAKVPPGYYGEWARCRHLTAEEIEARVAAGTPYTIRLRTPETPAGRVTFDDQIRGPLEQIDNRNDIVLLKSSDQDPRLPTYHLAHVVDDHLMRVTLVTRGEEWISSVPIHLQLFSALGFAPVAYAHIAPLMKLDGNSRRKLSKRKDPEASVEFYIASGYPAASVRHYLRGLANAKLADADFAEALATPLRLSECGVSGPIFDVAKLQSVSRNLIAQLSVPEIIAHVTAWANTYDPEFAAALTAEPELATRVIGLDYGHVTTRKDVAKWADVRPTYGLFFTGLFSLVTDPADARFAGLEPSLVSTLAREFADGYDDADDQVRWFEQVRQLATRNNFAASMSEFKKSPERFAGSIREVGNVIRVLITGSPNSRELFDVVRVLGREEVLRRVRALR